MEMCIENDTVRRTNRQFLLRETFFSKTTLTSFHLMPYTFQNSLQ